MVRQLLKEDHILCKEFLRKIEVIRAFDGGWAGAMGRLPNPNSRLVRSICLPSTRQLELARLPFPAMLRLHNTLVRAV
jgi:hypothetical protein